MILKQRIAGVDEAGRGQRGRSFCGVCTGAGFSPTTDGPKKLSATQRDRLFDEIIAGCEAFAIAEATVAEIDSVNILHASMLAMRRAVLSLPTLPDVALIDGNRCPSLPVLAQAIVKGDLTEPAISAASVLAKVYRDRVMGTSMRSCTPVNFSKHKGYPATHISALAQLPAYARGTGVRWSCQPCDFRRLMMTASFVHLSVRADHSLVDGTLRNKALVEAAREAGMPAVALTEQGNLFSLVKFYRAAMDGREADYWR